MFDMLKLNVYIYKPIHYLNHMLFIPETENAEKGHIRILRPLDPPLLYHPTLNLQTLSYNSLLQRPVPEERLGLSQICLFGCGKDEIKCLKSLP